MRFRNVRKVLKIRETGERGVLFFLKEFPKSGEKGGSTLLFPPLFFRVQSASWANGISMPSQSSLPHSSFPSPTLQKRGNMQSLCFEWRLLLPARKFIFSRERKKERPAQPSNPFPSFLTSSSSGHQEVLSIKIQG